MTRVLVVDDDPHIRELLRLTLGREGFRVAEARDGREALASLEHETADLVVLDLMMPAMDGFELCRELREAGDIPILMLTARATTRDKVDGLARGADDYLTKPFEAAELTARIRALLRRAKIAHEGQLAVGGLQLDAKVRGARLGERSLTLPPNEFDLLFHLASYAGRTLSREQLVEQIWGYDYPGDERTVDVHVKRLRDRLPEDVSGVRIVTVRGLGYRLEALK